MALEDCPSCGKRISEKARSCPKCGEPLEANWGDRAVSQRWRARARRLVTIVVVVSAIAWLSNSFEKDKALRTPDDLLEEQAAANAFTGQRVRASDFPNDWNLNAEEGILKCELGPAFQGVPRPHVLFETNGQTYALNGAAIGGGEYLNGKELRQNDSLRMIRKLISVGLMMCEERRDIECGTKAEAYGNVMSAVRQRLKNPEGAAFVSSHLIVGMVSCGVWRAESAVDTTNAFGSTVRTYFNAEVERTPSGNWATRVEFKN